MSKAIADPEELRRFAAQLKRFNDDLREQMAGLSSRLVSLGSTWRDQEHQKFAEELETAMRALARFNEAADQHVPFLLRKAERLDEYLRQR